jgi:hypothetical protein
MVLGEQVPYSGNGFLATGLYTHLAFPTGRYEHLGIIAYHA